MLDMLQRFKIPLLVEVLLGIQLAANLTLFVGCGKNPEAVPMDGQNELPILEAEFFRAQIDNWPRTVRVQGSLVPDEAVTLSARVAGRVREVYVDFGDSLAAGTTLVALEQNEFRLFVEQAESQLKQARAAVGLRDADSVSELDPLQSPPVREARAVWEESQQQVRRLRELRLQDAVSDAELEAAIAVERVSEARYASSLNSVRERMALIGVREAELGLARQNLDDTVITTPFDCHIEARLVAPGAFVQVGQPLIRIAKTSVLRFRGAIPERYVHQIAVGQPVKIRVEGVSEAVVSQVSRISPSLDEISRALSFEVLVDNNYGRLRGGLFAEADVEIDSESTTLTVPASAIVRFAGVAKLWTVVDGVTKEQVVELGRASTDRVEILRGLKAGDWVLVDASKGKRAKVKQLSGEVLINRNETTEASTH